MTSQRRVLVIGAGSSGLAAIKSCKEESLDVICYEKTESYGGRWCYREYPISGVASVMKSTVCKSSKEIGAFSDFPPPKDFPNYMHHSKMLEYLTLYSRNFDLIRHIKFQMEVMHITFSSTYENDGKWLVRSINNYNKSEIAEEFDCVMICTGRLAHPKVPDLPNQNAFKGHLLHSQSLKTTVPFENLNVLILGNGNSAVDAAVDISTIAQQVYLSTRNGFWVFPKLGPKGLPFDIHLLRRDVDLLKHISRRVLNLSVENYLDTKINHMLSKIKPVHRAMDKHPTVNDDLADKILTGRISIKGEIVRFEENGIIFAHEDNATHIDVVICATGYNVKFPFLDSKIYKDHKGRLNLYKKVFPMNLNHPTLAFIGFVESFGPNIPISESQSRWVSRIFSQKNQLMFKDVFTPYTNRKNLRITENMNELTEDYIDYMDELADEYGIKPNMSSMFFKDTSLFWTLFSGPFLPYQYRLIGPNCLESARNFILGYHDRVIEALKTRITD